MQSSLIIAVCEGHIDCVQEFVGARADVNHKDMHQDTNLT